MKTRIRILATSSLFSLIAGLCIISLASCGGNSKQTSQTGFGLGAPAPQPVNIEQCITNTHHDVIVGSLNPKPGCSYVIAAPNSATAYFREIVVEQDGVLTVPSTATKLLPLKVGDICLEKNSKFIVGTRHNPITNKNKFEIIFTGDTSAQGSLYQPCQHNGLAFKKGIDVTSGATLEMYGAKGVPHYGGISWTTLVKPAGPQTAGAAVTTSGPQTLYLTADVTQGMEGWQPGDWIVVATSNFVPFDTEFVQISNVKSGSNGVPGANSEVTLKQPLKYYHFGSLAPSSATATCPDPLYPAYTSTSDQPAFMCDGASRNYGVDERAEVGLISRDITLTSTTATIVPPSSITSPNIDTATINEHWGGEIKILPGFQRVAIEGVRLSKFGKAQLGSYPIHFHRVGDITASPNPGTANVLVDADSVDHSYNKCVTIHETSNLTISNMVCARIVGHIFYEELGDAGANNIADDSGITFLDDLGLGAMSNSFDINPVTLASPSTTTYTRQQLIAKYWWTGDYLTNDSSSPAYINYDGFNIPDTDNWKQATYGSCASYQSNTGELGGFTPPTGGTTACNPPDIYIEPATGFWIQNAATNLIGDAIGGCQGVGTGFWWVPPQNSIEVNGKQVYLTYQRLGTVRGDRVHACYNGFGNDDSIGFVTSGLLTPQTNTASPPSATAASLIATLDDVTATRNRFRGLWVRPTWYVVKNGHFATNRDNVSLLTSGGIDGNAPGVWELLEDSVLVGLSQNNVGRWGPCPAKIALNPPEMHLGGSRGCIDYTPSSTPHSGEIYNEGYQTPFWNSAGYYLYDGPVRVFHDRFVNFNHNENWSTSMPCTGPSAGAYYRELDAADCAFLKNYEATQPSPTGLGPPTPYEGDAALGWFLSNQNSYPTGTASRQLSFVNTNLRHEVFTKQVNIGKFNDGDKNTSIIDEDGTLDGYGVQLAPNSGTNKVFPISLNNLPLNSTSNSVDECLSRGTQNQQYEGRTSALMSPASMGTLQFSSLYPFLPVSPTNTSFPGATNSHWQDVTFTRDDAVPSAPPPSTATFHPTMVMQTGRGGLGSYEPKVSNGYGYTVRVSKTTAPGVPSNQNPHAAGLWKWIDITLADIVDPNVSQAHPFYIRLGIDYKSTSQNGQTINPPPPDPSYFTIKRGYKSYYGTINAIQNTELLKYWTSLPCQKLDAQNSANVPTTSTQGTCPAPSGTSPSGAVMALSSATDIGALTANGQPVLDKYYYNPTTGYLYLNIVQDLPNPIGPSPVGSCTAAYDGGIPNAACPDTAEGETYYACPKLGCIDYTITVQAPASSTSSYTYTPGPSTGRPDPANLMSAPAQQNKLLVIRGSNAGTVVAPAFATDDQGVPYYTATNAANACTTTQP